MTSFGLEICIDSIDSAVIAIESGATQLEVCSSLALGGLTPSAGLVACLRKRYPLARLLCMLRPRSGDFVFTTDEVDVMAEDAKTLWNAGATGFVIGMLTKDGKLDRSSMDLLKKELPAGAELTLHRAFDYLSDWQSEMKYVVDYGITTILTSGQEATAVEGVDRLKEINKFVDQNSYKINIMAGSGVNAKTLPELVERSGCRWFHGSASEAVASEASQPRFAMGDKDSNSRKVTSSQQVKTMIDLIRTRFQKTFSAVIGKMNRLTWTSYASPHRVVYPR